jgi:hypothetical protein
MSRKRWDEIIARLPKREPCTVIEVGTWRGKTSRQILERCHNATLYMIDRWECPTTDDSYFNSGSETARLPQAKYDEAYDICFYLALKHGKRAQIIRSDSVAAAAGFEDGTVDLIFIDGDHSYDGVKRDILAWKKKVKRGGWLGGHDYAHPDQGEVKRAVDELIGAVELGDNRTWWVRIA